MLVPSPLPVLGVNDPCGRGGKLVQRRLNLIQFRVKHGITTGAPHSASEPSQLQLHHRQRRAEIVNPLFMGVGAVR